ncbi:MAG: hypothetical protein ACI936_000301 [Paraglaciecola sp.]|jgi:hypothetical protein
MYMLNQHPDLDVLTELTEKNLSDFIAITQHQRRTVHVDDSLITN